MTTISETVLEILQQRGEFMTRSELLDACVCLPNGFYKALRAMKRDDLIEIRKLGFCSWIVGLPGQNTENALSRSINERDQIIKSKCKKASDSMRARKEKGFIDDRGCNLNIRIEETETKHGKIVRFGNWQPAHDCQKPGTSSGYESPLENIG